MTNKISDIRSDYKKHKLDEKHVLNNPIKQFEKWFEEALVSAVMEPTAMNLATVSKSNTPASRIVLLKDIANDGFVFYTNYQSNKGKELEENPQAALTFFWPELERQVRIQGVVEKVSKEKSEAYFKSRPRESQIGAWASPQSAVIADRKILEDREKQLSDRFAKNEDLPKPEQWGGYLLKPLAMEFWQGRPSRLHDRLIYTLETNNWKISRLAP